ncbi:MAG TPA: L,D-transpeptidase [Methylomusa anaerophila]|uniref:Putative L,D-transpeptidase YkuD n=1 Tax=Methylomusa anaerophila TaxID=1930071 RepID=A0A348AHK9_9FIRM|nr:L,D-transpeptidase [Methylomusa anaerophila]BBB90557.1 putative L,D-transpeptidase YkuD [Methylomusa anaerophila]HML88837.1 L,D-transpeptidase [Methylomusa anaerophila]
MAYSIKIVLSQRQLFLYSNGKIVRSYPVGVGKAGSGTPAGRFAIATKKPHPGGPFGVMWLGLSVPHYGIHGTNNPSSIGGMVSKGCVRMYNPHVLELARLVPIGTPVVIVP